MKNQLENARRFLAAVVTWPGDGLDGYVNIHARIKKAGDDKPIWFGRACQTLTDAINTIDWMLSTPDPADIYFCTSLQSQFEEKTSRTGRKYKAAIRRLEYAVVLRSFFLDIDYGGAGHKDTDNGYVSLQEALQAFAAFVKQTGLPKPSYAVKTGGGLHVYWTLAEPLEIEVWRQYAFALAEAGKKAGLKADYNATVDAVRILRVPETFNHKLDQPRPVELAIEGAVYSNDRILQCLEPFKVSTPPLKSVVKVETLDPLFAAAASQINVRYHGLGGSVLAEITGGISSHSELKDLDEVSKECAFLRTALETGGRDFSQPFWNFTTLISTFTGGGRDDAHRMACGHRDYTQESTDALYDRKEHERKTRNLGYPSCKAISGAGCTHCATCPHLSLGKSPLNLGSHVPIHLKQATPLLPKVINDDMPDGYRRRDDGIICELSKDEDGNEMSAPLGLWSLEDPYLQKEPEGTVLKFNTRIRGQKQEIRLPCSEVGTQFMRMTLQAQDVMIYNHKGAQEGLVRFMVSWIKRLQETKEMVITASYGWTMTNGKTSGFSYADKQFSPLGVKMVRIKENEFTQTWNPTGEDFHWYEAWELVKGRPELEVIVASAFAAPLMHFTGHNGMTLSAYSTETGAGKSTALELALAVWGCPKSGKFKTSDTYVSAMNKIGQLRHLPVYWDEIKTQDQFKIFLSMAFDMTLGVEKSRSRRDGTAKKGGDWQTLLTVCCNDSLLGYIANNSNMNEAGVVRIFEYEVQKLAPGSPGLIDTTTATQVTAALNENYGHLGLAYAEFLGEQYDHAREEVTKISKLVEKQLGADQDERFWTTTIAVLLAGAKFANKQKLAEFDVPAMKKFLFEKFEEMRVSRKEAAANVKTDTTLTDLLAQFLAAHTRNTLWTTDMPSGPGGKGQHYTVKNETTKLEGVKIQIAEKTKTMRIAISAIKDWCKSTQKVTPYPFIKGIVATYNAKKGRATLGAGTSHKTPQQPVIDISLAAYPELDVFN